MCAAPGDELGELVEALEVGDWRRALELIDQVSPSIAGLESRVRWAIALERAARAMQRRAQGLVAEASDQLGIAASQLPRLRRAATTKPGCAAALLMPEPEATSGDVHLSWRIARLLWREQFELEDLRRRFAPGQMKARDELIEACIEHLSCVEFDSFIWSEQVQQDDGTTVDRTRMVLCGWATRLRQFADPTRGKVTQSVWQDIGGYRRLRGAALTRLAARAAPAPWCGARGTSGLKVSRGRVRAWQYARIWRGDLNYWNHSA